MSYASLSDEDKLNLSIDFVAHGQSVPEVLKSFLVLAGLHTAVMKPGYIEEEIYVVDLYQDASANLA